MTQPNGPHHPKTDTLPRRETGAPGSEDSRLKQALQSLPGAGPGTDCAGESALEARILSDWQALQQARQPRHAGTMPAARFLHRSWPRHWALAGGAVLAATLTAVVWLQRPDPAFDELLHPDVLSQMAIGEL